MSDYENRMQPRDALEVSPFNTGHFEWKMNTRSIEESSWLQVDAAREDDLLLKCSAPKGLHLSDTDHSSGKLLKLITTWLECRDIAFKNNEESLHPIDRCGQLIQEDVCLMEKIDNLWIFTAGSVSFPTRWDPKLKLGLPLDQIHEPVPRYEVDLQPRPANFMERMPKEKIVARTGWTLTSSAALHLMPSYIQQSCEPGEIILRVERQTLRRIPDTEAIAFTIRIHRWPLEVIGKDPDLSNDLIRALQMIPEEVSNYKKETVALSMTAQQYLSKMNPN